MRSFIVAIFSIGPMFALCACISVASLKSGSQGIVDSNTAIGAAVSELDQACQDAQHTEAGLKRCQQARDRARQQLRSQLDYMREWTQ